MVEGLREHSSCGFFMLWEKADQTPRGMDQTRLSLVPSATPLDMWEPEMVAEHQHIFLASCPPLSRI